MNVGKCAAGLVAVCAVGTGCAAASGACKVIDTAHDVCVVLQYVTADGGTERVTVAPQELASYGRAVSAGHWMVPVTDAGCK